MAEELLSTLKLPLIAAPMFLSSGPDLVVACCEAGIIGTFPAHNQRTVEGFEQWCRDIKSRLSKSGKATAPFGVNLIVHKSNKKLEAELDVCIEQKVPLIITSLGAVKDVVDRVHAYGGLVFHDVINLRHAEKASEAGVDGLIAVSAGAGGHTGSANPFALVSEIESIFEGYIILSGSLSSGRDIAAAQVLGADFAYMGTRFIATEESESPKAYKEMLVESIQSDIRTTSAVTGINANFLAASLEQAGIDPTNPSSHESLNINEELDEALKESPEVKPWRDIWSAGHGVGGVKDILKVSDLVDRLEVEYHEAIASQLSRAKNDN